MPLNDENFMKKWDESFTKLTEGVQKAFNPKVDPPVPIETWQQKVDREAGEKQELLDMFERAERDPAFASEWRKNAPDQYEGAAALYWSPALIVARAKAKYQK